MLAEVRGLTRPAGMIRIPPQINVPVTDRVRRILDSAGMQRLHQISQLGMVSLIYPGAKHSRWEHSIGVYHNALRFIAAMDSSEGRDDGDRLDCSEFFSGPDGRRQMEAFVLAALVHDIGHWPFCHPIEDMQLAGFERHENRAQQWLRSPDIVAAIEQDWQCDAEDVAFLLNNDRNQGSQLQQFFASCLSGPIDVDKLDYLQRDSLHCGVPYGRQFDADRLIASLKFHPRGGRLAIGEKGRTAAEMMVFARYVMFSEVYWHRTVRAATAMLQRSVFLLQNRIDLAASLHLVEPEWIAQLQRSAAGSVAETMVAGLFGKRRMIYKTVAEFDINDGETVHTALSRRPYWYLVAAAERLAEAVSAKTGVTVHSSDLLIDAPPVKLEVDINVDIISPSRGSDAGFDHSVVRSLGEVSPVAAALARHQFDRHVKRVRIFVRPDLRDSLNSKLHRQDWANLATEVATQMESTIV